MTRKTNRICKLCGAHQPIEEMAKFGQVFACADRVACYDRVIDAKRLAKESDAFKSTKPDRQRR